jgi:hypothetical protein
MNKLLAHGLNNDMKSRIAINQGLVTNLGYSVLLCHGLDQLAEVGSKSGIYLPKTVHFTAQNGRFCYYLP